MKVTIKYEYERMYANPFVATAYIDDKMFDTNCNNKSFDESKKELIEKIKVKLERVPTVIPEQEEIEL